MGSCRGSKSSQVDSGFTAHVLFRGFGTWWWGRPHDDVPSDQCWSGCTKHEYLHSDKVVKKKLCFWCRIELSAQLLWAIRTHLRACTLRYSWSTSDMTECFGFVESCWKSWEQTLKRNSPFCHRRRLIPQDVLGVFNHAAQWQQAHLQRWWAS